MMTYLEYAKRCDPNAPAFWLTNGEVVGLLEERDELRKWLETLERGVLEIEQVPHGERVAEVRTK